MKWLKVLALSALMFGFVACGNNNHSSNDSIDDSEDKNSESISIETQTDWKDDEKGLMVEVLGLSLPFINMAEGYMVEVETDEKDEDSIVIYDESPLFTVEGYGKILEEAGYTYDEETTLLIQMFLGLDMTCYEKVIDDTYAVSVAYYHYVPDEETEGFEGNYIEAYVYDYRSEIDMDGDGSLDAPYTISQCLDIISTYEPKGSSDEQVYIIGSVKEVKKQGSSGDLQIVLEDSSNEILCYYVKMNSDSTSENNWESMDVLQEGDVLVIYGQLKAYQEKDGSITPEVNSGAYCVYINGYTPDEYFGTGYEVYNSWLEVDNVISSFFIEKEIIDTVPEIEASEYYVSVTMGDSQYIDCIQIEIDGNLEAKILDSLKLAHYTVPKSQTDYGYECISSTKTVEIDVYYDDEYDTTSIIIYSYNDVLNIE